jgi:ribulose-5-phosphate 4-epimerase/fuculose-1-phosphate aldolase
MKEAMRLIGTEPEADTLRELRIPSLRDKVSPAEWRLRVDLAACYRLVALYGMSDLTYNHISARIEGTDEFLINSFGLLYEEMTASSLIKVDHEGKVLAKPDLPYGVNPAGFVLHSAVHEARPEVGCVIHTHSVAGMAVSAMKCGLLPLTQTSMRFAKVAYHDYEGVVLDLDEQARLVRDLGDCEAMILRNHGLLVVGATIPEAFNALYRLERACQSQLLAMAATDALIVPPPELVASTARQYQPGVRRRFGLMEWPAMLRKLDRIDPTYRS